MVEGVWTETSLRLVSEEESGALGLVCWVPSESGPSPANGNMSCVPCMLACVLSVLCACMVCCICACTAGFEPSDESAGIAGYAVAVIPPASAYVYVYTDIVAGSGAFGGSPGFPSGFAA